MAKLNDMRSRVSASFINRTLDSIGELFTFQCGAWGKTHSQSLIYHACSGGPTYLEKHVIDGPYNSGWMVPETVQPVMSISYSLVANRYHVAAVRRETPLTANVTGADLLLRGSALKSPICIDAGADPDYEQPGDPLWSYGTDLQRNNHAQARVTIEPYDAEANIHGNWPYPGGKSADGVSWFADNPNISHDSPYWMYAAEPDLFYEWAPMTIAPEGNMMWGGTCLQGIEGHGAGIIAHGSAIGLPLELQTGCKPEIVSAYCEMSFPAGSYTKRKFKQTWNGSELELTTTFENTDIPLGLLLLGGVTDQYGWPTWTVLSSGISGATVSGKNVVVDCTDLVRTLLEHSEGVYDSFSLLPSIAGDFVGGGGMQSLLEQLLKPEPVWAFQDGYGWYISESEYSTFSWTGYSISAPIVTVRWPASELQRAVYPMPLPPLS